MMMRQHCEALRSALAADHVPAALDALVCIAEQLIDDADKTRAADVLALVLCYPLRPSSYEHATSLFADLESELCPRVIWDARAKAAEMTLNEFADALLVELASS